MDKEVRVKIEGAKQKELFEHFLDNFSKDKEAAKLLGISKYSLSNYKNNKTRYIPENVLRNIVDYLGVDFPDILESKTLKEIRRIMAKNATISLKNKYGREWKRILQKGSKLALEKKYGKDAYKKIAKKGHDVSRLKYGDNWRKEISKKGVDSLKNKYGEKWFDVTLKKGREVLKDKYGINWQKKLSDLGRDSHNRKYVEGFNKMPRFHKSLFAKRKPTISEQSVIDYLKKNEIPFESNILEGDIEFDIIIPNRVNPRYVIEICDAKPTTYNQRMKVLQLYQQKKRFPQAQIIALLRTRSLGANNNFYLSNITKSFLDKESILLLSLENLQDNIDNLMDIIKNGKFVSLKDNFYFPKKSIVSSRKGSVTQSKKMGAEEKLLHDMLVSLGASPLGGHPMEIDKKSFVCFDNFEIINNTKIAYEINSSRRYNSLRALAGKLLMCRKFRPDIKYVVILTNPHISNNSSFNFLSEIAERVILNKNFNKDYLYRVRKEVISQPNLL